MHHSPHRSCLRDKPSLGGKTTDLVVTLLHLSTLLSSTGLRQLAYPMAVQRSIPCNSRQDTYPGSSYTLCSHAKIPPVHLSCSSVAVHPASPSHLPLSSPFPPSSLSPYLPVIALKWITHQRPYPSAPQLQCSLPRSAQL